MAAGSFNFFGILLPNELELYTNTLMIKRQRAEHCHHWEPSSVRPRRVWINSASITVSSAKKVQTARHYPGVIHPKPTVSRQWPPWSFPPLHLLFNFNSRLSLPPPNHVVNNTRPVKWIGGKGLRWPSTPVTWSSEINGNRTWFCWRWLLLWQLRRASEKEIDCLSMRAFYFYMSIYLSIYLSFVFFFVSIATWRRVMVNSADWLLETSRRYHYRSLWVSPTKTSTLIHENHEPKNMNKLY